ncbi:MAG: hypothetical protein JST09_14355 [Bacteroidetes bacterium]|nr:hypothetical protein [Bacteroidota bacterium]
MRLLFFISSLVILIFNACRQDDVPENNPLYGQWKTSYGDTITFSIENGRNILTYDMSLNASMPVDTKKEFIYRDNKLGLLDGLNGNDFRMLQTFKWKEQGKSFEVQGVEWFLFISSTTTYFTFVKI